MASQVFLAYEGSFPIAASSAIVDAIRGRSQLDTASKINAGYDVGSYALGNAFPVSGPAPGPFKAGPPMSQEELADILDAHCKCGSAFRREAALSINWVAVASAAIAFVQALIAAGA